MDEQRVLETARKLHKALEEELKLKQASADAQHHAFDLEKRYREKWEETMYLEGDLRRAIAGDLTQNLMMVAIEKKKTQLKEVPKKSIEPWDYTIE